MLPFRPAREGLCTALSSYKILAAANPPSMTDGGDASAGVLHAIADESAAYRKSSEKNEIQSQAHRDSSKALTYVCKNLQKEQGKNDGEWT